MGIKKGMFIQFLGVLFLICVVVFPPHIEGKLSWLQYVAAALWIGIACNLFVRMIYDVLRKKPNKKK